MSDDDATKVDASEPTPESLLPGLKAELGADCEGVSDDHLLMFLYWKACVSRASQRFRDFVEWRASSTGIFDESLRISKDPELERLLMSEVVISPPNLKTKAGGPLLIGRFRNNDMTDGRTVDGVLRMLFYTMDRVLNRPETQKHGITIVHDLRGFDRSKNSRIDLSKRMIKSFLGQFPLQLKAVYFCHAPMMFVGFFKIISFFLPKKIKDRVNFIDDFSELATVHGVMELSDLLPEMGGELEWSVRDWIDEQKLSEESGDFKTLTTF